LGELWEFLDDRQAHLSSSANGHLADYSLVIRLDSTSRLRNNTPAGIMFAMSVRDVLKNEIECQPEPVLAEVLHYLRFIESQREDGTVNLPPNHGLVDLLLNCPTPFDIPPREQDDSLPLAL
jgi:hypothetical protein